MKKLILVLLLTACGHGAPIQPYCPGPANTVSGMHFFGDSITYGSPSATDGSRAYGYAQMVGEDLGMPIDNVAVPGSVVASCGQLPSILSSKIESSENYIYFTGTNDIKAGTSISEFSADFTTAFQLLNVPGVRLVVIGPYYFTGAPRAMVDSYNEAIKNIAGTAYIDLRGIIDTSMLEDGTHPNPNGARAIAEQVEAALK